MTDSKKSIVNPHTGKLQKILEQNGSSGTVLIASSTSANSTLANYICDGINDEVEIQLAIDSLPNVNDGVGGGKIILLEGQYNISDTIVVKSGVEIIGQWVYGTKLFLADNTNKNMFEYQGANNETFFRLSDLYIDGNKDNNTSGGVYSNQTSTGALRDSHFSGLFVVNFAGIVLDFPNHTWGTVIDDVIIEFCTSTKVINLGSSSGSVKISNSKIIENEGDGIYASGLDVRIINCEITTNEANKAGIRCIGGASLINNCSFKGSSDVGNNNNNAGIILEGINNQIVNCRFSAEGTLQRGLVIEAGSNDNLIINTVFNGYTTSLLALSDGGLRNRFMNNFGSDITQFFRTNNNEMTLMPNAELNVSMFSSSDVGDGDSGKRLQVYRKASEGDQHVDVFVDSSQHGQIESSERLQLTAVEQLRLRSLSGYIYLGDSSGILNEEVRHYGYLTATGSKKYASFKVDDNGDIFRLIRQDGNLLAFKIEMPVIMSDLPVSDPLNAGELWNEGGTLKISSGV